MVLPPIPTPYALKGVDDQIRFGFEAFRNTCFNWLLVSTGVVVVGLLFELPEIWHESINAIRELLHSCKPERHIPAWMKLVVSFGWLLIVVGVAGEFVADSFVSKADGFVQKFDEILLADAQRKTGLASERAASAFERAAQTEREASQENERAARAEQQASEENARAAKALEAAEVARKSAEGFSLQIAQANERAARAEKDAAEASLKYEEERKARLLIEQRMADRDIKPEQRDKMLKVLRERKPSSIRIESLTSEGREGLQYAMKIADVFRSAKWDVTDPDGRGMFSAPLGGVIIISSSDQETQRGPVDFVARVLIAGEISGRPVDVHPNPNRPTGTVEIWVGSK